MLQDFPKTLDRYYIEDYFIPIITNLNSDIDEQKLSIEDKLSTVT